MRCVSTAVAQISMRLIHSMTWMANYGDPCRTSRTLPEVQCEVTVTFSNKLVYNLKYEHFNYEGWNFNSGNYLFTTDTKLIHVSKFYCPSV